MSTTDSCPRRRGGSGAPRPRGGRLGGGGAGAAVGHESLNSLKPGGRLMITGGTSWPQIPFKLSILQGVRWRCWEVAPAVAAASLP
jgi:hypothetical protein